MDFPEEPWLSFIPIRFIPKRAAATAAISSRREKSQVTSGS